MSEVQPYQACLTRLVDGSDESKLVSDWQPYQARYKSPAVGNGVLNEVSPLLRHAWTKFTLLASVPSFAPLGNCVREEQTCHALAKFEQFLMSVVVKLESELLLYHA